jgi:hypothetical protein
MANLYGRALSNFEVQLLQDAAKRIMKVYGNGQNRQYGELMAELPFIGGSPTEPELLFHLTTDYLESMKRRGFITHDFREYELLRIIDGEPETGDDMPYFMRFFLATRTEPGTQKTPNI